jgi:hypothetical protein
MTPRYPYVITALVLAAFAAGAGSGASAVWLALPVGSLQPDWRRTYK